MSTPTIDLTYGDSSRETGPTIDVSLSFRTYCHMYNRRTSPASIVHQSSGAAFSEQSWEGLSKGRSHTSGDLLDVLSSIHILCNLVEIFLVLGLEVVVPIVRELTVWVDGADGDDNALDVLGHGGEDEYVSKTARKSLLL